MPRRAASHLKIDSPIRVQRVYPVEGTKKDLKTLKTVGLRLTKDQAVHLAITLLAASRNWEMIDVTAYRLDRRKDGTHHVTVTSFEDEQVEDHSDETNGG
jgi:hypothetical protein